MRFELTTLTLARLCSTPELRPHPWVGAIYKLSGPAARGKVRWADRKFRKGAAGAPGAAAFGGRARSGPGNRPGEPGVARTG